MAIKDQKAGYFLDIIVPMPKSIGEAERTFEYYANDPNTLICKHPEDFVLYHLGELDNQTGQIHHNQEPKSIIRADALKRPVSGPDNQQILGRMPQ